MTKNTPAATVAALTDHPVLPAGDDERFTGFGIMGLPFDNGHYLALRQFPAASFAPAYTSVWHRDPHGVWTFYATTPAEQSCARYFSGSTHNDAVQCDIDVAWLTPWWVKITIGDQLAWSVHLGETGATRLMSAVGARLPERMWTNPAALQAISRIAGPVLGVGRLSLTGVASNGQHFAVAPRTVWAVTASRAVLRGVDLGLVGPLSEQARLGDFWCPQRGVAVVGSGHFETFDAQRHRSVGRTVAFR